MKVVGCKILELRSQKAVLKQKKKDASEIQPCAEDLDQEFQDVEDRPCQLAGDIFMANIFRQLNERQRGQQLRTEIDNKERGRVDNGKLYKALLF